MAAAAAAATEKNKWLQKPHTMLLLVIGLGVLVFRSFWRDDSSLERNQRAGLLSAVMSFLVFCGLQMADGILRRPHPVFWRVVKGLAVLYNLCLVYALFLSTDQVRNALKFWDSSLGVPLPERNYGTDCRVYTPGHPEGNFANIKATFLDEFVVAHVLGWFGKGLIVRDWRILTVMSVWFEVIELSLKHVLPNFHECWWDHVFFDLLICNPIGIMMGMWVYRYFNMHPFHFFLDRYEWNIFKSPRRFFQLTFFTTMFMIAETNSFFLKTIFWVPPPNPLNAMRLILLALIGQPAIREFYDFIVDPKCTKVGTSTWLCTSVVLLEVLLIARHGRYLFQRVSHPPAIIIGWAILLFLYYGGSFLYFVFLKKKKKKKTTTTTANANKAATKSSRKKRKAK